LRRYATTQNDARIVLDLPDGPVRVAMGDKALGRVIANLVGNALNYGRRAFAAIETDGTQAVLVIEDEGPGIPVEERERVFEPFHRLEASRNRDSGGTGLGLTIVRRLVDRHGGGIELDTTPARGACRPGPAAAGGTSGLIQIDMPRFERRYLGHSPLPPHQRQRT